MNTNKSETDKSGDSIREFFKRWPRFYYAVMIICGPGFLSNLSARGFLQKYPRVGVTLNVGSGPRVVAPDVVNVDITAYESVSIVADAAALPSPDGSIARLIYDTVLEHVDRPEAVVAEANRVLESGGYAYMSIPFMYPFHSSPSDYTRWTEEGIRNIFVRHNFEIVELGVRAGPFSIIVLWMSYLTASLFCFGNRRLYWMIVNVTLLIYFPIKIFDVIAVRLPFIANVSSILYVVAQKKRKN